MDEATRDFRCRVEDRIRAWRVAVERVLETGNSTVAFGRRGRQPVTLKVVRNHGDEWRSGEILQAFEGKGVVRVYEFEEGAMLLERATPGDSLAIMSVDGRDDEATVILAEVIRKISPRTPVKPVPTVEDWGEAFERHAAGENLQISRDLLAEAHRVYFELCRSQSQPRLLHGDLHHYNVVFDTERGWLAIDPKGVVGELEYEVGALLRNPFDRPELFTRAWTIEKRVERLAVELNLNVNRTLAWAFAQAVLSAIWAVEDGFAVELGNPCITLAGAIRPMLGGH
jgi:streptomycin 6-kinase